MDASPLAAANSNSNSNNSQNDALTLSTAAATPSGSVGGTSRMAVPKDKQCKYCSQVFTSSSLGRHLDQYLFKKKPDGLHNIDEIRQLRSHITRRTPRSASSGTWRNVASPTTPSARSVTVSGLDTTRRFSHQEASQPNPATSLPAPGSGNINDGSIRTPSSSWLVNQAPWRSDVLTNGVANAHQAQSSAEPSVRQRQSDSATDRLPSSVSNRALELALHEVLDNVKAATLRVQRRVSPFDFDLQSQNYPSLCLRTLPPPPTILSSNPFPSNSSFTIEPPTSHQKELIQANLKDHIEKWKAEQLSISPVYDSNSGHAIANDPGMVEKIAKQHEEMILRHMDLSLNAWESMTPETQRHQWHLEIMRALALESDQRKRLEEQLMRAQQGIVRLQSQVDKIAAGQWPREFYIAPPDIPPLPVDVARELGEHEKGIAAADSSKWDYDNIVAKWKRVVAHDRSFLGRSSSVEVSPWAEHNTNNTDAAAADTEMSHENESANQNQNQDSATGGQPQQKRRRLAGDNENNNSTAPTPAPPASTQSPYIFAPPNDPSQQPAQSSLSLRPISPKPSASSPQTNTSRGHQQPPQRMPPPYSMQDPQTGSPTATPPESVFSSVKSYSSDQAHHFQQQSGQTTNARPPTDHAIEEPPGGEIQ